MGYCDSAECPRRDDYIGTPVHRFAGYGFYVTYHPECCPLEVDGTFCDEEHPRLEQRIQLVAMRAVAETYRYAYSAT